MTSNELQAKTFSSAERPGSAPPGVDRRIAGSGVIRQLFSASRTLSGIAPGVRAGTRMRPRRSTSAEIAWQSSMPGVREDATPVAGMLEILARLDRHLEGDPPRAPRKMVGRSSASRGPSEPMKTSAASSAACSRRCPRARATPDSSPISIRYLQLKPSAPRTAKTASSAARLTACWPLLSAVPRPYQRPSRSVHAEGSEARAPFFHRVPRRRRRGRTAES